MQTVLTSERVTNTFRDCLFREGEETSGHVRAEGITTTVGFHPERLTSHKADIEAMLAELSADFKKSGGGGMSFLNACMDRNGDQWTGFHLVMEQLFLLGMGVGLVQCQLPREMWRLFPGGMPYYVINDVSNPVSSATS